jgi:hypothetical protein
MFDAILAGCKWLEGTPLGAMVRDSAWMYPAMKWVHFVGLSIWLGAIVAVDLRLIGVGARRQTATQLSNGLFVWRWIGFFVAFLGGFLLFSVEATNYVLHPSFLLKLAILTPLALILHVVVHTKAHVWTKTGHTSAIGRWAGLFEFLLWMSVVAASVGFLLTNVSTYP